VSCRLPRKAWRATVSDLIIGAPVVPPMTAATDQIKTKMLPERQVFVYHQERMCSAIHS
jgi:hypothetical protein